MRTQICQRKPRSGFTLVELLVVIAIIAVLAALLLPALANSKMQAQQTVCLNDLKQMTVAGQMYLSDTSQGLPDNQPIYSTYDPDAPENWMDALANYEAVNNVLHCPSTQSLPLLPPDAGFIGTANLPWITWDISLNQSESGSYGFNGYIYDLITPFLGLTMAKLTNMFTKPSYVQKPSQTPFFFDEVYMDTFPLETDPPAADLYIGQPNAGPVSGGRGIACCTILRHGGTTATASVPYKSGPLPGAINMTFDDGHGELAKLQNLWTYTWHMNWNYQGVPALPPPPR